MSHQFKPGDLALTLIDLPPVMAGSVVELVERLVKGNIVNTPSGPMVALCDGWICAHDLVPGNAGYADNSLMQLRGDFAPDQLKSKAVPA